MRLLRFRGVNLVVLGDNPVDAVEKGMRLAGEMRDTERPLFTLDPRLRDVDYFTHSLFPSKRGSRALDSPSKAIKK